MTIDIFPSAAHIERQKLEGATAVVIDVLRATSVMVTAFANGLKEIIPVSSPDAAFAMRQQNPNVLLGGEKDAICVPGFDIDNSPFNYTPERVKGRTLVMSTSNGTRAINGSDNAEKLIIASFLNAKAICNAIKNASSVVIVCSGSNNTYTLEDALCAGYIIQLLKEMGIDLQMTDFAFSLYTLCQLSNNIQATAAHGNHYKLLLSKGFPKDLDYCFTTNTFDIVPKLNNGIITL